jgi:hypothetical protein
VMRALLKAAIWADDPANETALTVLLERPDYVNAPRTALGRALSKANPYGLRFQAGDAAYPRQAHALWLLTQMRRWGQISAAPGQEAAARAVYRPDLYRKAAAAIGAAPPRADIDTAPLPRLFDGGAFDPAHLDDYVAGFAVRQRMAPAR